jgi:hypothetical protein
MANSDKDILISPAKNTSNLPEIDFVGLDNDPITLRVLDDNTISFEGSAGQLFSINNNLTSGSIFSVNDVSGVPSIDVTAEGKIYLSPYYGHTVIGNGGKILTGLTNSRPHLMLNSRGNTSIYDMEVIANHGISDGNYGGITFTQGSNGSYSTQLCSMRIEYTNSGHPHIGFYTRSGQSEVRRFIICGGNGSNGRDGTVGIGIDPGTAYNQCSATLNVNAAYSFGGYNGLMLTNRTDTSSNDRGAAISCMSNNPTQSRPWVGFGMWSSASSGNIVYLGGGGWNLSEATQVRIYTGATVNSDSSRATLRWTFESSGDMIPFADATYNIGSTSNRVNNIYTTDLHLSNRDSQNVVDGTWGDWTLQEGENDIYMLNNRNGKRFKMVLQEVQ